MLSIQPTNTKQFMSQLFLDTTFDRLCLREAKLTTAYSVTIDGKQKHADGFIFWQDVRPLCLRMIQGDEPPESFSLVFMLPGENKDVLFAGSDGASAVDSLLLNVRYDNGRVQCTTAVSYNTFTLDKSQENRWDRSLMQFFDTYKIEYKIN